MDGKEDMDEDEEDEDKLGGSDGIIRKTEKHIRRDAPHPLQPARRKNDRVRKYARAAVLYRGYTDACRYDEHFSDIANLSTTSTVSPTR